MAEADAPRPFCTNCRFAGGVRDAAGFIDCRRRAPIPVSAAGQPRFFAQLEAGWPRVHEGQWCGDHEPPAGPGVRFVDVHIDAAGALGLAAAPRL